jgi:hypothetical protein
MSCAVKGAYRGSPINAKLTMIDLAGSERDCGSTVKVSNEEMDSRIAINQSLTALTEVICKLNSSQRTEASSKGKTREEQVSGQTTNSQVSLLIESGYQNRVAMELSARLTFKNFQSLRHS